MVIQPALVRLILNQYGGSLTVQYDHLLNIGKTKNHTLWIFNLNVHDHSMKCILVLFDVLGQESGAFYNPNITKDAVIIEGVTNRCTRWA